MADQIEKVVTGYNNEEPLPIAGTESPGIASFNTEDFLVDAQGRVEALTKLGIAHVLKYIGSDDNLTKPKYTIEKSFGKQLPKVGDVGLVLSASTMLSGQVGNIVRLTEIQSNGVVPIVYYGEVLGSILGPKGDTGSVGPRGEQGSRFYVSDGNWQDTQAAQAVNGWSPDTPAIRAGDYVVNTGKTNPAMRGKVMRMRDTAYGWIVADICGPTGTKYVTAIGSPDSSDSSVYNWRPTTESDTILVGDYVIAAQPNEGIQRGDMYKIIQIVNNRPQSIRIPTISTAQFQLGIWAVSNRITGNEEGIEYYIWDYSTVPESVGAQPLVGNLALCIDDNDEECFGKLYVITATADYPPYRNKVLTLAVGSDLRGPIQELDIGDVVTIPNDETGAVGKALADVRHTDRLHAVLDLGIPQGERGEQGIQGPQGPAGPAGVANVTAKGDYNPETVYRQNDLVFFANEYTPGNQGASYICNDVTGEGVRGKTPITDPDEWGFFVAEGAQGPIGPVGPVGVDGKNGVPNVIVKLNTWTAGVQGVFNIVYRAIDIKIGDEVVVLLSDNNNSTYVAAGDILKGVVNFYDADTGIMAVTNPTTIGHLSSFAQYVIITNPNTATNGNLTNDQFATLQASRDNKIIFDNEIYSLEDQGHDAGYNVYTHTGHNSQDEFVIKCITVNTNNKSWVLTTMNVPKDVLIIKPTSTSYVCTAEETARLRELNCNNVLIFYEGYYYRPDRLYIDSNGIFYGEAHVTRFSYSTATSYYYQSQYGYIVITGSSSGNAMLSIRTIVRQPPKFLHHIDWNGAALDTNEDNNTYYFYMDFIDSYPNSYRSLFAVNTAATGILKNQASSQTYIVCHVTVEDSANDEIEVTAYIVGNPAPVKVYLNFNLASFRIIDNVEPL